ncbi:MAG: hypothetical protein R2860_00935 [Desulfobacterales bacterium]
MGNSGLSFMHRDGPLIRQLKTLGGNVRFAFPVGRRGPLDGFRQADICRRIPVLSSGSAGMPRMQVGKLGYSTLAEVYQCRLPVRFCGSRRFQGVPRCLRPLFRKDDRSEIVPG